MVELPNENGKRRYFVKSLHTTNYYEAQEKAVDNDNRFWNTHLFRIFFKHFGINKHRCIF